MSARDRVEPCARRLCESHGRAPEAQGIDAAVAVVLAGRLAPPEAQPARAVLARHRRSRSRSSRSPGRGCGASIPRRKISTRSAEAPGLPAKARIVEPYRAVGRRHARVPAHARSGACRARCGSPSPRRRRRCGSFGSRRYDAAGYHVYRNIYDPEPDRALGLPLAEILDPRQVSFEDRFDLEPGATGIRSSPSTRNGVESDGVRRRSSSRPRSSSAPTEAEDRRWLARRTAVRIGDELTVPYHPLGTDYLGRDMLARLMYGARVSLFIGVVAPFLFVAFGVRLRQRRRFRGRTRRPGAHARSPISSSRCRSCCS